jgi:hypothetical protein
MRPYDLKYLSKKANAKHIDECIIVPGYVLVTRSGTIGRVGLVSSAQNGWTASEHLLRIVPKGERVVKAFELKDEASVVEECAIRKVEEILQKGKAA